MKAKILSLSLMLLGYTFVTAQVNNQINTAATPAITTGDDNTGIGASVFTTLTTGSRNTFIGHTAGDGAVTNDDNTYVGFNSRGSNGLAEAAAIGANAEVTVAHTMILGRANDPAGIVPNLNVGIGSTAAPAKLTVYNGADATFIPGMVGTGAAAAETFSCNIADHAFNFSDVSVLSVSLTGTAASIGTGSIAGGGSDFNAGVVCLGGQDNATMNAGIIASAGGNGAARNWGVWGDVILDDGALNIAVAGIVDDDCGNNTGNGTQTNYGVYGSCDELNTGLTATTNNYAGYFAGHVITTAAMYHTSDARLKENVSQLTSSLEKIRSMNFYTYNYKRNEFPQMNLASGKHYGVIAQELEKVFPELITNTSFMETKVGDKTFPKQEYKAVNYTELIPVTMQAVQELDKKVEALNKLLKENGIDVATIEEAVKGNTATKSGAVLEQNAPNPFNSETTIRYYVPENVSKVMLVVMNLDGEVIMKDSNLETGRQEFKIRAGELKSGTYFYTLFCDNELVATRKMIMLN